MIGRCETALIAKPNAESEAAGGHVSFFHKNTDFVLQCHVERCLLISENPFTSSPGRSDLATSKPWVLRPQIHKPVVHWQHFRRTRLHNQGQ